MIKKAIIAVVVIGSVAFVIKNIYFEPVKKITQKPGVAKMQKSPTDSELYRGQFKGMDYIHNVAGDAVIMGTGQGPVLRLEKFSSSPGPDLFVYLSKNENVTVSKDLGSQYVSLGGLQKLSGDQSYTLPENFKDYKSVVVWSRAFNILFGAAPIK